MAESPDSVVPSRAFHPLDLRQARARLFLATMLGLVMSALLSVIPGGPGISVRIVAGWNTAAMVALSLSWAIIWRSDVDQTRRRAGSEDPGRSAVWGIVLFASVVSVFASFAVLRRAKSMDPGEGALLVGLCLVAVVSAWALTHTAYTLRYAHLYYREDEGEGEGGLTFPGDRCPDYFDFAYFSFTVGMCFQVSDVTITSPAIRRAVLGHSMLSFAYNTAIVALALNLAFGMLG